MVKFKDNYDAHIASYGPEHYLNYDILKKCIYDLEQQVIASGEEVNVDELQIVFPSLFKSEVAKLNEFIRSKLTTLEDHILLDVLSTKKNIAAMKEAKKNAKKDDKLKAKLKEVQLSIKRALTSTFQLATDLESFRLLNLTLCLKILKKHDKVLKNTFGCHFPALRDNSSVHLFGAEYKTRITDMIATVELTYAEIFCKGDVDEAHGKLINVKGLDDPKAKGMLGVRIGVVIVLACWFMFDALVRNNDGIDLWNDPALYLYSFLGNLLLYKWLWGLLVYVFSSYNVNYILLLHLDGNHPSRQDDILLEVSLWTIFYLIDLILYYKSRGQNLGGLNVVPALYYPLIFTIVMGGALFYQFIISQLTTAHGVFSQDVVVNILRAPFGRITMHETYAADILTSFVRVLNSGVFGMCYLVTETVYIDSASHEAADVHFGQCRSQNIVVVAGLFAILPLWFRFAQCVRAVYDVSVPGQIFYWPHSYNALKYLSGMVVVVMTLAFPVHNVTSNESNLDILKGVVTFVVVAATCYVIYWDTVVDWGLFQIIPPLSDFSFSGMHKYIKDCWDGTNIPASSFLRSQLMYEKQYLYYLAIGFDVFLRWVWTLSLVPQNAGGSSTLNYSLQARLLPFIAALELCRRCMWGMMRLEWEHIKRANAFQASSLLAESDAVAAYSGIAQGESSSVTVEASTAIVESELPLHQDEESGLAMKEVPPTDRRPATKSVDSTDIQVRVNSRERMSGGSEDDPLLLQHFVQGKDIMNEGRGHSNRRSSIIRHLERGKFHNADGLIPLHFEDPPAGRKPMTDFRMLAVGTHFFIAGAVLITVYFSINTVVSQS